MSKRLCQRNYLDCQKVARYKLKNGTLICHGCLERGEKKDIEVDYHGTTE